MWFKKVALYANRYERHRKVSSSFSEVMILTCCHDAMPVIGVVLRLVVLIKRCNDGLGVSKREPDSPAVLAGGVRSDITFLTSILWSYLFFARSSHFISIGGRFLIILFSFFHSEVTFIVAPRVTATRRAPLLKRRFTSFSFDSRCHSLYERVFYLEIFYCH